MYTPNTFVPENDITIKPKNIIKIINNLLDYEIDYYSNNDNYIRLLKIVKKSMINRFKEKYTWKTDVLSHNVCDHIYGEHSKKFKQICGSRIDIKPEGKSFKCAKHIGKSYKPKDRNIDEKSRCIGIKKNGNPCKMEGKHNRYCIYHYNQYKIDKLEKDIKDLEIEKIHENVRNIVKSSFNTSSLYNIIENIKNINISEDKNKQSIELLEFAPHKLNNSNTSNKFAKIKKIIKNNEILENFNKTDIVNNLKIKLDKLNNKIDKNIEIIDKLDKNYKNNCIIEYKQCEQENCTNCKNYYIVYNSYCSEHILNRKKNTINFFYKNKTTPPLPPPQHNTTPTTMNHHDLSFSSGHDQFI